MRVLALVCLAFGLSGFRQGTNPDFDVSKPVVHKCVEDNSCKTLPVEKEHVKKEKK